MVSIFNIYLSFEKDGIWEVHCLTIKDAVLEDAASGNAGDAARLAEFAASFVALARALRSARRP